jgi:tetratricopeptide (TPR) repeat protein
MIEFSRATLVFALLLAAGLPVFAQQTGGPSQSQNQSQAQSASQLQAPSQSGAHGEAHWESRRLAALAGEKIAALYSKGQYRAAVAEQNIVLSGLLRSSPEFKRGQIVLTYLLDKVQSPHQLVFQAREALDFNNDSAEARTNLAALQLITGDYSYARQLAAEALSKHQDDWLAPTILAQALANEAGRGKIQALQALSGSQRSKAAPPYVCAKWLYVGQTYQVLKEPACAVKAYQQALKAAGNSSSSSSTSASDFPQSADALREEDIRERLVCAAAEAADKADLRQHLSTVLRAHTLHSETLLSLGRHLPLLASSTRADQKILATEIVAAARRCRAQDAELWYGLGRAWQEAGLKLLAVQCFEIAAKSVPDEGKYVLAYCNQLFLDGKTVQARELLGRLDASLKLKEPSPRRVLVAGLVPASLKLMESGGSVSYKVSRAQMQGVKCYCRVGAMAYILRHQPGVIFAYVPEGKGPNAVVIYDPAVNQAEKIWAKVGADARPVIQPDERQSAEQGKKQGQEPSKKQGQGPSKKQGSKGTGKREPLAVNSFPELLSVATRACEEPVEEPHPHYFFEPLPLRLPP